MNFVSNTSGLQSLRARLADAKTSLPFIMTEATQTAGTAMAEKLGEAAPHGQGAGSAPPGDAPGSLADSFEVRGGSASSEGASISVVSTQPTKLGYVVKGTGIYAGKGRITPVKAKALYWEGAPHPFRSVAGQRPNPFVDPVVANAESIAQPAMDKAAQDLAAILGGH